MGQDNAIQYKTMQDKRRQDDNRHDNTTQAKTRLYIQDTTIQYNILSDETK